MTRVRVDELPKLREDFKDKKIAFCSGSFDLVHAGHILFFEDCKKYGDILVVGVGCDEKVKELKGGNRPILNEEVRVKMIDSLKPVDYCFLDDILPKDNPLDPIKIMFEKLKPDYYLINDDAFNIPYREKISKIFNVKLIILKRTCPENFENISTTKIIEKIKKE